MLRLNGASAGSNDEMHRVKYSKEGQSEMLLSLYEMQLLWDGKGILSCHRQAQWLGSFLSDGPAGPQYHARACWEMAISRRESCTRRTQRYPIWKKDETVLFATSEFKLTDHILGRPRKRLLVESRRDLRLGIAWHKESTV